MKTYNFTVNGKSQAGTLAWNPNGTLNQLSITDTFNAGGSQICNYLYDDLGRLGVPPNSPPPPPTPTSYSVDCGSSLWRQVFSYDQYDNLTKTGNPGTSWTTGYNSAYNQYIGSSYDSDGHLTYDGTNTYSWDGYGKMIGVRAGATAAVCGTSGSCATYDALGRIVETSTNATYKEYLFGPTGRLAQMSGATVTEVDLPLPGGLMLKAAGANGGGSKIIMHNDWLGTNRLGTVLGTRAPSYDTAYAPYGETYDTFGTPKQDFTGDFQDIFTGLFDTPNRELATNASRWLSPDPAGASWNAYAYPTDPNTQTDPTGLCDANSNGVCNDPQSIDPGCPDANCVTVSEGANDHIIVSDHFHRGHLVDSLSMFGGNINPFSPCPMCHPRNPTIAANAANFAMITLLTNLATMGTGQAFAPLDGILVTGFNTTVNVTATAPAEVALIDAEVDAAAIQVTNPTKAMASDLQMQEVMSGSGDPVIGGASGRALQDAPRLAQQYGGDPADWVKVSSSSYIGPGAQGSFAKSGYNSAIEAHAYMNVKTGEVVEVKTIFSGGAEYFSSAGPQ
jgi:RHS repeat-associated protein